MIQKLIWKDLERTNYDSKVDLESLFNLPLISHLRWNACILQSLCCKLILYCKPNTTEASIPFSFQS